MFLENSNLKSFTEYIKQNYPNSCWNGNDAECFSNLQNEISILKNGVGLRVISNPTIINLVGKETLDFLHRISTNSLKEQKPFDLASTLFLNEKGKFISQAKLLTFEDYYWLISDADAELRLFSWINKYIINEDITTTNISSEYCTLSLMGQQAKSFLTLLIGDELKNITKQNFRRYDADGFTFFLFMNSFKGIESYSIILEKNRLIDFVQYLISIKSVFDLELIGSKAYTAYRIENGIADFPNEINPGTTPHDINLTDNIDTKKGCYIGQEVIARLDTYDKIQRKLVKLILAEPIDFATKIIYNKENLEIGTITSYAAHKNEALGIINRKMLLNGNGYYTVNNGKEISIKVVEL